LTTDDFTFQLDAGSESSTLEHGDIVAAIPGGSGGKSRLAVYEQEWVVDEDAAAAAGTIEWVVDEQQGAPPLESTVLLQFAGNRVRSARETHRRGKRHGNCPLC